MKIPKVRLRLKLMWKIILTIVIIVTLLSTATVIFVGKNVSSFLLKTKKETIELALDQQAKQIDIMLSVVREAADGVPQIKGVSAYMADKNRKTQDPAVLKSLQDFGIGRQVRSIYLLDEKGKAVLSTDESFLNLDFSYREYFKKAILGESSTEMLIGAVAKQPGIFFSAPIRDQGNKIIGVSVIKMDPQSVYETLIDSYIDRLGKFMLVNDDGVVFFTNKESTIYKSLGSISDEKKKTIVAEERYQEKEIIGMEYDQAQKWVENRVVDAPIYEFYDKTDKENELIDIDVIGNFPFYLVVEVSSSTITDVVFQLTSSTILLIVLIVVVGTVLEIILVGRMLNPLQKLNSFALNVSAGKFGESVSIQTGDELESLTDSVKQMVLSLKSFYAGLEDKVAEKTAELEKTLHQVELKNEDLEKTKSAVLNVMEDLNEEKTRLFFEKSRVETILKSIGDGVFVTDNQGKITMVNKAAEVMSGYQFLEAKGKQYSSIFKFGIEDHPEIQYPDFVKEVISSGNQVSLEKHSVIVHKDGTEIPVLDSAAPVKDVEGKTFGCVVVFRNNTRERELERSKDDFLSVTSHQLRTPLGSMRWNVEMLLAGDAGKLPDEAEMIARQIHEGNLRMIGLVNDLLNVNRIDQGRVLDEPAKTDLAKVIGEASKELEFEAKARRVSIQMHLKPVEDVVIDPKRFREVIMNLVSNAVKYNKVGGRVEVSMKKSGNMIEIAVKDNGVGIPKKDLSGMFKKFFRASNAVHSETEGSGLGLYVVKKFVEGWGGKIGLESKEGKGSKFTIYLPINIKKIHIDE